MLDGSGRTVYWGTGEHIWGPLFTNGTLRTSGVPVFHDEASYGTAYSPSGGPPNFMIPGQPELQKKLVFPSSNSTLKNWSDMDGYSYTGTTCIFLNADPGDDDHQSTTVSKLEIKIPTGLKLLLPREQFSPNGVIYVNGDLFISGILDGNLTILAEKNIYLCAKDPTNFNFLQHITTPSFLA